MKLQLVARKEVTRVKLEKDGENCIGILIKDGTNNEAGPVIKKIGLETPAEKSLSIGRGDVILSLNGLCTVGTKSKDVRRMLNKSRHDVDLILQYEIREIHISDYGGNRKQQLVTELCKTNDSFGFVLRNNYVNLSLSEKYPVISNIKEGSDIHRNGQIWEGDRLLKVDDLSLCCLPLADIARVLQKKNKAEFTFEYNIRVDDFEETGKEVNLDIDLPVSDLGMCLNTDSENPDFMYIESIRPGSISERCGAFCEGDNILSVNEIDTKFLTAFKANELLQDNKKCRKLSFIRYKRNSEQPFNVVNESCDFEETATTSSSDEPGFTEWKHFNTPATPSIVLRGIQWSYFQEFRPSEQIHAINKLQDIVQVMRNLKQSLSQLTYAAFDRKQRKMSESCGFCNNPQRFLNLCASCLANMNAKCTQSMDVLQNIVTDYVTSSSDLQILDNGIGGNSLMKVSTETIARALTETLPEALCGEFQIREKLENLAKKIISLHPSCNICDYEVKSVWVVIQKLLLLFALKDNKPEIKDSIDQLTGYLLDATFYCDSSSNCQLSCLAGYESDSSGSFSTKYLTASYNTRVRGSVAKTFQSNTESESKGIGGTNRRILSNPQVSKLKDYLKIADIQSISGSEEFCNENERAEANMHSKNLVSKDCESLEINTRKCSDTSFNLKDTVNNNNDRKIYKGKGFNRKQSKVCRSLDSILNPIKYPKEQPEIINKFSPNPDKSEETDSNVDTQDAPSTSFSYPMNPISPNHEPVKNDEDTSDSRSESARSSSTKRTAQTNESLAYSQKIRTDTVEVKMTNNGRGFGLVLGVKANSANSSAVPVVHTIERRSPSQKVGVLKVDDRIIAINHQSTLELSSKEFQDLKTRSFSASQITLTVEFDVIEADLKLGTFDVILDRTLKTGLVFKGGLQRGIPLVVSGVVKGSAAHRCGQLFPGDKITFIRCFKKEYFEPIPQNYRKEEYVVFSVQRNVSEGNEEKSDCSSQCYLNPSFNHRDSVPRTGMTFVVKSTALHSVGGTHSLVLDHAVTLYRDPVFWDFGFLVGENPWTGRGYVTDIRPDGPAYESGVIKKFDRIIEVNGIIVDKIMKNSVRSLLSQANHKVDLIIRRLYREGSDDI